MPCSNTHLNQQGEPTRWIISQQTPDDFACWEKSHFSNEYFGCNCNACENLQNETYREPSTKLQKNKNTVTWHTTNTYGALHLTHPKCTHTAVNTHTQSSGHAGSSWGFGVLLKGTPVVELKEERALYIHSPSYNPCRTETQTHNLSITSLTL